MDPLLTLAFALHTQKGAYAVLLGSGISTSAGIPTGWDIVLNLVRRIAALEEKDCEPDPESWYAETFGEAPTYDRLIKKLAKTKDARRKLLQSYIEPTQEEREEGLKIPSPAHRAVAELVASEYVRLIVTTNFDRLLETALSEAGVEPTVIASGHAAKGMLPLAHEKVVVLKVHGDYLDTRIKNTPAELVKYDKGIDDALDRIFDEYGLIVCGWSADWDTALRDALERCKSRRFTTYWAAHQSKLTDGAKALVRLRRAQVVPIEDADSFFQRVLEKVTTLGEFDRLHPLSTRVAVATLKRYLADSSHRIRLHDLVIDEVEKVYSQLAESFAIDTQSRVTAEELERRLTFCEAATETLQAILATGCYWGEANHDAIWRKCIERLGNPPGEQAGSVLWIELRYYPALLVLYAGGIGALAAEDYRTFRSIVSQARVRDYSEERPAVLKVYGAGGKVQEGVKQLLNPRRYTPLSERVAAVVREPLRPIVPDDARYEDYFDRFEYLAALAHADEYEKSGGRIWGPVGRFGWQVQHTQKAPPYVIAAEVEESGEEWPPLKAGLFSGSVERFIVVKNGLDQLVESLHWF